MAGGGFCRYADVGGAAVLALRRPRKRAVTQRAGAVEDERHDGVRGQAAGIVGIVPVMGDAAVGREVVETAGVVAEPDVVAAAGDREPVVAAHLRLVGLAVVAEAPAGAVGPAQAAGPLRNPSPVPRDSGG